MQVEEKNINEIFPGMIAAEDISGISLIADKLSILSTLSIVEMKAQNISTVKILIPDEFIEEKKDDGFQQKREPDPYEELLNSILLYDKDKDNDLEIKKQIKKLTKWKDPKIIEAMEYILLFFPDAQGREFALEGLNNISSAEILRPLLFAVRDENPKVRRGAFSLLQKFRSEISALLKLIDLLNPEKITDEIRTDILQWILKIPGIADLIPKVKNAAETETLKARVTEVETYISANS